MREQGEDEKKYIGWWEKKMRSQGSEIPHSLSAANYTT